MTDKYIIAHDMGTSADKAVLITVYGKIIDSSKRDYPLYHPHPGFAEQDPLDWWNAVRDTTRSVLKKTGVKVEDIVGMTFSSQMQGLVPISKEGKPLMRAMTWLDSRAAEIMRRKIWTLPRIEGYNIFRLLKFLRITGGAPGHAGKDIIGKILWLQENKPEIFLKTYKYLGAKDFVTYNLTGNMVKSTDLAVVWWLLDTRRNRNKWSPKLCKLAEISVDQLPEVRESAAIIGNITKEAAKEMGLLPGTPVINGAGDITAAALGSGALEDGKLHIRIGTSGGVAGHFIKRKINIITYCGCIGSAYPQKYYLGIATQETAGICLEWLKNKVLYHEEQLKKERHVNKIYQVLDQLAEEVKPGAEGLIFTPWMFGERCPLNDSYVRGGLFNLGLNHSREHLTRAVLEGIAFNTRWAMESLEKLYSKVTELNIVGGGAKSDTWCQIMADVINRTIHRVDDPQQASARGVALLASMTLGYINDYHDISNYIKINRSFYPNRDTRKLYDKLFQEFKNIYKQNRKWYARMNS